MRDCPECGRRHAGEFLQTLWCDDAGENRPARWVALERCPLCGVEYVTKNGRRVADTAPALEPDPFDAALRVYMDAPRPAGEVCSVCGAPVSSDDDDGADIDGETDRLCESCRESLPVCEYCGSYSRGALVRVVWCRADNAGAVLTVCGGCFARLECDDIGRLAGIVAPLVTMECAE